ncbi:tRNA-dihydrouridine synthase family protein [Tenacibaculum finnmarkense genomovar finnmarkense]|uniref:tRNA dihydrouridine synthase n=1 Tax=Tenacibaculum TaxID=104267 RepID=UPI00187B3EF4|nr:MULTISPECIES: tRNA-dihydrouridine synthase family protein [Tenacibaculum]MBE7693473.1 tRNA-dihydrouridine synthase family protein [Tenacibaculum finnmarkense genomovar finnmarkense]MCD8418164.1 tRNA-dihydrouridine synthase family protein [Tenacibaculum finnmarkense genomovar finnmarkense]MCG8186435.1 tRNA-dihydrouridine synthase family protein [Tenacibaculum finnmarkense genomovar finnmarkense]MCG8202922.1 tRNA-dihydrouridine synthase family protein [Tenacibaculum finnmarkense genomovar finn
MSFTLLSSPLQGFTDFRFRNAQHKYFGGIDTYYAPYIRLNGKMVIKSSYKRDLLPENNNTLTVIPQVITNDPDEFLFVAKYVQSLGYKELNWNLGCPYPMVTKSGMGSGLICNPAKIDEVLHKAHNESDILVSMKMRMGYENSEEILNSFPILDKYPLKNIAIHARIGKQLYKGGVDLDAFQKCIDVAKHQLYYNGDITSVAGFKAMQERFPSISHFMIGRGLIADPFLPQMIKDNTTEYPEDRWKIFEAFHNEIYQQYDEALSGPTPIKMKMLGFWEYFSKSFDNPQKTYKQIKKAGNQKKYQLAVKEILSNEKKL